MKKIHDSRQRIISQWESTWTKCVVSSCVEQVPISNGRGVCAQCVPLQLRFQITPTACSFRSTLTETRTGWGKCTGISVFCPFHFLSFSFLCFLSRNSIIKGFVLIIFLSHISCTHINSCREWKYIYVYLFTYLYAYLSIYLFICFDMYKRCMNRCIISETNI